MKTLNIKIAGLLILTGLLAISAGANSQNVKPDKQSRKEAKKAERVANFYALDSLLNFRTYVLEANYLQNKYGNMVPVTSNLNFIRVTGETGVLQTGSDLRLGYNGVGGVTAEGSIGGYKIVRNSKSLSFTVTFTMLTNIGNFDIFMNVSSDGHSTATISGNTSGKLTWNGQLVPLNRSRVFKGQNTI